MVTGGIYTVSWRFESVLSKVFFMLFEYDAAAISCLRFTLDFLNKASPSLIKMFSRTRIFAMFRVSNSHGCKQKCLAAEFQPSNGHDMQSWHPPTFLFILAVVWQNVSDSLMVESMEKASNQTTGITSGVSWIPHNSLLLRKVHSAPWCPKSKTPSTGSYSKSQSCTTRSGWVFLKSGEVILLKLKVTSSSKNM